MIFFVQVQMLFGSDIGKYLVIINVSQFFVRESGCHFNSSLVWFFSYVSPPMTPESTTETAFNRTARNELLLLRFKRRSRHAIRLFDSCLLPCRLHINPCSVCLSQRSVPRGIRLVTRNTLTGLSVPLLCTAPPVLIR